MTDVDGKSLLHRARMEDFLDVLPESDVVDLLTKFLDAAPAHVARIDDLLDGTDPGALAKEAHKLKGIAVNLGAERVADTARRIESAVEAGAAAEIDGLCGALRGDVAQTIRTIRQFVDAPEGRRLETLVPE